MSQVCGEVGPVQQTAHNNTLHKDLKRTEIKKKKYQTCWFYILPKAFDVCVDSIVAKTKRRFVSQQNFRHAFKNRTSFFFFPLFVKERKISLLTCFFKVRQRCQVGYTLGDFDRRKSRQLFYSKSIALTAAFVQWSLIMRQASDVVRFLDQTKRYLGIFGLNTLPSLELSPIYDNTFTLY